MTFDPFHVTRREDRETALAMLYEADMTGDAIGSVVERHHADPRDYSTQIALGVAEHLDDLDQLIAEVAQDWSVGRMPGIDRSILRMGTWELGHRPDVPTTAIVAEAVALANQYSTERSAPFVNGVLVALSDRARSDEEE